MLEPGPDATIGQVIPDYELLRCIGRGAYGEVWLAQSKATGALRAAKVVWRRAFEDERPFQREFEGIQRFERISREHPSQLALFHIGRNDTEGYFYYVMELADDANAKDATPAIDSRVESYTARTLRNDLNQGRLAAHKVLEIGLSLTEALGHLHRHGLVHRDVKPSNVIFVSGRPKLADIGLVTDATDQCSIVGTEGYLPPEGPGTPQGDIFALGRVLYEAVTGLDRREFPRLPQDLRSWPDASVVFELNEVILTACAPDSRIRYASIEPMLADLQRLQAGDSVKRNRIAQKYFAVAKKALLVLGATGILATTAVLLLRKLDPSDPYPDGLRSTNLVADSLCEKALAVIREDNYVQFPDAYTNFQEAIKYDPYFARPYVGLLEMAVRDPPPHMETAVLRKIVAARLRELAPDLGATAVAQSVLYFYALDFPNARRYAEQAIAESPKYEFGHTWYAYILTRWGRPGEALRQLDISRKLAPSKAIIYRTMGHAYYARRDFVSATNYYQQAINLDPRHSLDFVFIGRAQRALGDYERSMSSQETADLLSFTNQVRIKNHYLKLRQAYESNGPKGYWQEAWRYYEGQTNGWYFKATIQIRLGNADQAFDWLDKSFTFREGVGWNPPLNDFLFDECWDSVREDRRSKRLLAEVGFTKVMPIRRE